MLNSRLEAVGEDLTGRRRAIWLVPAVMWVLLALVLAKVLLSTSTLSSGAITDSGGRIAVFVLGSVAILPLLVRSVQMRTPRWVPWALGAVSATVVTMLWLLVTMGREAVAWSLYGGLQVLRAAEPFSDLIVILRSVDCAGCTSNETIYGPGIAWLNTVTFGFALAPWTSVIGLAMVAGLSLVLVWLARNSAGIALPLFALTAVSSAWLLLLDRANLDAFVLALPVVGVWLLRRRDRLWAWSLLAAAILVLGTWKFYPLALGILLVPVLRLKRGWMVLLSFGVLSAAFLVTQWGDFKASSQGNANNIYVTDFPALGRIPIVVRMDPSGDSASLASNVLVYGLALAAAWWGAAFARRLASVSRFDAMLATSGSLVFLASVLVAGFSFAYKAPFLLLAVPLISKLRTGERDPFLLYSAIAMLTLTVIPLVVAYSILLTSLAGIIAASFAFGAGCTGIARSMSRSHADRIAAAIG